MSSQPILAYRIQKIWYTALLTSPLVWYQQYQSSSFSAQSCTLINRPKLVYVSKASSLVLIHKNSTIPANSALLSSLWASIGVVIQIHGPNRRTCFWPLSWNTLIQSTFSHIMRPLSPGSCHHQSSTNTKRTVTSTSSLTVAICAPPLSSVKYSKDRAGSYRIWPSSYHDGKDILRNIRRNCSYIIATMHATQLSVYCAAQ